MKEEFLKILRTVNREGIEDFIKFLESTDFFTAPASTRFHGNYEGGLLEHSMKVYEIFKEKIKDIPIYEVSAIENVGLDNVINALGELVKNTKEEVLYDIENQESHVLYKFKEEKPFTISKDKDVFVVKGEKVEKLFKMTNFSTEEAYVRFSKKLKHMGLDDELESMNIKEGDIVRILDYEFEYRK